VSKHHKPTRGEPGPPRGRYPNSLEVSHAIQAYTNGHHAKARAILEVVLRRLPSHPVAHYILGRIAMDARDTELALEHFSKSTRADPSFPAPLVDSGTIHFLGGRLQQAAECFRSAISAAPNTPEAHNNLGSVLKEQGLLREAIACFRRAIEIRPNYASAHSNLLFTLHYDPDQNLASLKASHVEWANRHCPPATRQTGTSLTRDERPLKVGFLSPDLYRHSVGCFLASFALNHDRSRLHTVYYADSLREDEVTQQIRETAWAWRNSAQMSDDRLMQQIAHDSIDILVDLAGHTAGNRLRLFARRAAPIQISWLGYFNTTGVPAMDYIIMDPFTTPLGYDQWFTEKVIRLPVTRFCYLPPIYAPPVSVSPWLNTGYLTFGSFNNLAKITPEVIDTWSEILRLAPQTKLVLKWRSISDAPTRERLQKTFVQAGVETGRIECRGWSSHQKSMEEYGDIDLALDPFPFSGAMTSCDALYMGVSVLSWAGELPVGRQTGAFLSALGLEQFIARDRADYVRRAVDFATTPHKLAELRGTLRERMLKSALCNGAAYAAALEGAFYSAWRSHLSS
jgi:protein O-GlcNAc transferase